MDKVSAFNQYEALCGWLMIMVDSHDDLVDLCGRW